LTWCPGKSDHFAIGGPWARAWGARRVVTLLEQHELAHLAITRLGEAVQRRGLEWLHRPIPDVSSKHLRSRLDAGENILIHCRGGVGRSGMVAARLLVEFGVDAETAIARVRAARPGAIETWEQEQWVRPR
jgi:protein-tyrosine phosphatase